MLGGPDQCSNTTENSKKAKGKGFPYSIPSVGPGADPGVQAVSPQVTVSHPSGVIVKGQKFKIEVLLNILGRSWQVVSKYSIGSPES